MGGRRMKNIENINFFVSAVCTMCDHGRCARPGVCLCQDGWTGSACDKCIPSIGCANGGVCQDNVTNTCQCVGPWTGHLCEDPLCTWVFVFYHQKSLNAMLLVTYLKKLCIFILNTRLWSVKKLSLKKNDRIFKMTSNVKTKTNHGTFTFRR